MLLFNIISTFILLQISICEVQTPFQQDTKPHKIAIIGAGAGGSSSAFYLQNYTSNYYNITIFEKSNYVGGRSTTIKNHSPDNNLSIELGASVFVGANRILCNAVREFNLSTTSFDLDEKYPDAGFKGNFGVWNGTNFVYKTSGDESYIGGIFKILWKYGISPIRIYKLVQQTVGKFVHFFYYENFPFRLNEIVEEIGFDELTGSTGYEILKLKKISDEFSNDIVEASTRVNYASNLNDIHGLETVVSMAAEDTMQVIGGNFQIFENFIKKSGAKLLLNTNVYKVSQLRDKWIVESDLGKDEFDQVIIAAPLDQTGIVIEGDEILELEKIEYRTLYVTYVSTPRSNPVNHSYFGDDVIIPEMILTRSSEKFIPFYSINIVDYDNITDTIFYKIFSPQSLDNKMLSNYLFQDIENVSIIFSKIWEPYPILKPTIKFPDFEIGQGLWYLNSMGQFISTMETSALAGASVAGLISKGRNTTVISLPFY